MTLSARGSPACTEQALTTAGCSGLTTRPTMLCRAERKCPLAVIGSLPRCGLAPWVPMPLKVTCHVSDEASCGPNVTAISSMASPGMLCRP